MSRSILAQILDAGAALGDLTTPTLRLGVTGLSRAGKTVFITALVRNLLRRGRLAFFHASAEGRIDAAYLEPQPDDDVPRFAYESHLAALARMPPEWPESTRRISQLRLTIAYRSAHPLWRQLGPRRLHVDIVDYPGEWLIDLALLGESYAGWAAKALAAARLPGRAPAAQKFLAFASGLDASAPQDEPKAIEGAALFAAYLAAERRLHAFEPTLGPGRFLLPGDLEGSPLLTFLPLDLGPVAVPAGSLSHMMERRFNAYKTQVVRPFFRDHFARLDRQVVLVDALSAIDRGPAALADLEATLTAVLASFRTGAHGLLSAVLPRRIDRILMAATKADHLPQASHDRLEAILAGLTARATHRASLTGTDVKSLAIASLRSTREAELKRGEPHPHILGTPLPGERIGTAEFDGTRKFAIDPGELPATLEAALAAPEPTAAEPTAAEPTAAEPTAAEKDVAMVRFRPERVGPDRPDGSPEPWPHIRLDRAIEFLIGDRLA